MPHTTFRAADGANETPVSALTPLPVESGAGRSYANYLANGTAVVKSGAGVLHAVIINTKGASANVLTLYDNTAGSGTKIATVDTTTAVGTILYGVAFATGLTVTLTTGAAADITVSYR